MNSPSNRRENIDLYHICFLLKKLTCFFLSIIFRLYAMTVNSGYENKAYDGDNPVKVC